MSNPIYPCKNYTGGIYYLTTNIASQHHVVKEMCT